MVCHDHGPDFRARRRSSFSAIVCPVPRHSPPTTFMLTLTSVTKRYGSLVALKKSDGKMGKTAHLSADDLEALETYLRTL